jgi:hypothetical protein
MASPSKKSFLLRLPPELFEAYERWAADDFRSINAQMEWALSETLKKAGRKPAHKSLKSSNIEDQSPTVEAIQPSPPQDD